MATTTIKLTADGKALMDAMSELNLYLDRLPDTFRQLARNVLLKRGKFSRDAFSIETLPATGEGTILVVLKPSDRFLDLLSACRAGKLDGFVVKRKSHKRSPQHKELV